MLKNTCKSRGTSPIDDEKIRIAEEKEDQALERKMSRAIQIARKLTSSDHGRVLLAIALFSRMDQN